jgi:putative ABC transport system permease protein
MIPLFPGTTIGTHCEAGNIVLVSRLQTFGPLLKQTVRDPLRSLLLVVCALLVAGFCFAVAVIISGASASLMVAEEKYGADLVVFAEGAERDTQGALLMGAPVQAWMPRATVGAVAAVPGVATASPQVYLATVQGSPFSADSSLVVVAIDPTTDFTLSAWSPGTPVSGLGDRQTIGGTSISAPNDDEPITVYGYELDLVGTLERTGTIVDRTLFVTFATATDMLRRTALQTEQGFTVPADSVSSILVRVTPGADPEQVAEDIGLKVPGVSPVTRSGLFDSVSEQMRGEQAIMLVVLAVVLALSLAVIALVFSMVVNERRREIGVMRALGATRTAVLASLLGSVTLLALAGAVVGIALSALVLIAFRGALTNAFGFPFTFPSTTGVVVFVVAGLAVALCGVLAAASVPAYRISGQDPALSMRE